MCVILRFWPVVQRIPMALLANFVSTSLCEAEELTSTFP